VGLIQFYVNTVYAASGRQVAETLDRTTSCLSPFLLESRLDYYSNYIWVNKGVHIEKLISLTCPYDFI